MVYTKDSEDRTSLISHIPFVLLLASGDIAQLRLPVGLSHRAAPRRIRVLNLYNTMVTGTL